MSRIQHMHISVRGVLLKTDEEIARDWRGMVMRDDGTLVTSAYEIRQSFMDELAKGHEVLPFGKPCEGFDYAGGGCPGHEQKEEVESDG